MSSKKDGRQSPSGDIGNSKPLSSNEKKKEKNRKYAKDSRNRQKDKLESLEQLTAQQECILEIYKKTINIYHKRLKDGAVPSWSLHEISWQQGSSGNHTCQLIKCFLPLLDDDFLEELGNGQYGKIVSNGTPKMLHTLSLFYSDQKCNEIVSGSKAHEDFSDSKFKSDEEKCRQFPIGFNTTEYSIFGSVSKHLSQATAPSSSDKSGAKISTSVNTDTNGSSMCAKSQIISPPILKYEPNDYMYTSQNYFIPLKKEIVTAFDGTPDKVGRHTTPFQSFADHSSKTTQSPSCFPMPNSVRDASHFLGNQNSPGLSAKKVNGFGSVLSENAPREVLALVNDITSQTPANSMSRSSWPLNVTPRHTTAYGSSQNKDKVTTGSLSSSSFSYQDTSDQDSNDVDCLQASLETVSD